MAHLYQSLMRKNHGFILTQRGCKNVLLVVIGTLIALSIAAHLLANKSLVALEKTFSSYNNSLLAEGALAERLGTKRSLSKAGGL